MEYGDFLQCVQERAKERAGKGGVVSVNHVIKNNGCELDGLVIMEKGRHISPTIYLNGYYQQYQSGKKLDDIVCEIIRVYTENKDKVQIDTDYFSDFQQVKKNIVYKVINYARNKKLLERVPHKKLLDLAVVYYCLLGHEEGEAATALIYNNHLAGWGVTEQDIYEAAVLNTPNLLQSQINPLSAMIGAMIGEYDEERAYTKDEMYVLTNKVRMNGAACILYEDVLQKFASKIGCDLYILPSSVHEVILLPKLENYNQSELANMVREVNAEGVAKDEILSDNVYIYHRSDGMISM